MNPRGGRMYKHILVPHDGFELSANAVQHGMALAKTAHARVTGMTVTRPFQIISEDPEMLTNTPEQYAMHATALAMKRLEQIKDLSAAVGIECDVLHIEHDQPYQAILDVANRGGCDLIVMASHGRRGVSAILLASETIKVLTYSTIPVLVYR
jgi:nucleotide-binding universal stress UspA family protein